MYLVEQYTIKRKPHENTVWKFIPKGNFIESGGQHFKFYFRNFLIFLLKYFFYILHVHTLEL